MDGVILDHLIKSADLLPHALNDNIKGFLMPQILFNLRVPIAHYRNMNNVNEALHYSKFGIESCRQCGTILRWTKMHEHQSFSRYSKELILSVFPKVWKVIDECGCDEEDCMYSYDGWDDTWQRDWDEYHMYGDWDQFEEQKSN